MRQRLGVAAALLKEPDLLILDEPTNGLDPQGMVEMRELLRSLGQGSRTVLLSSHLLGEVEQICHRVGVIQNGRLVVEGTLDELRGATGLLVRAAPEDRARQAADRARGRRRDQSAGRRLPPAHRPRSGGRHQLPARQADLAVSELRPSERSLEEVFLRLTGGEAEA